MRMALGSREGQIWGSNLYERLLAFPVWPCDVSVCKWETCTAVGQMESSVRAGRFGASIPMRMREHQNLGWLPKTVAHANPSRIQRIGETRQPPVKLHWRQISLRVSRWRSAVVCTLKRAPVELVQQEKANIEIFQWNWPGTFRANPKREKEGMMRRSATSQQMMSLISTAPPPHPPPRCRFFLLFFVCFGCFSFLVILAGFSEDLEALGLPAMAWRLMSWDLPACSVGPVCLRSCRLKENGSAQWPFAGKVPGRSFVPGGEAEVSGVPFPYTVG